MKLDYAIDVRPKPKGWAKINGKKYPTVLVGEPPVQRFPANRIIRDLVDAAREGRRLDLNEIVVRADRGSYSKEEMHELYRLMGYSVCGFSEVFEDDLVDSSMWKRKR